MITPRDFVDRWKASGLLEQQANKSHFDQLCQMVGHKTPTEADPQGTFFTYEKQLQKADGSKGRADVWYKGHFAWEYKTKGKSLDRAYSQLQAYRGDLGNPPLLVVCDFNEYRIYPQWPNISGHPFVFYNHDLLEDWAQDYIRWLLESPERFLEERQNELKQREYITLKLAEKFAELADLMRRYKDDAGRQIWSSMQIARFLTKITFVLFVEDIELLPYINEEKRAFHYIIHTARSMPVDFVFMVRLLFEAMRGERPAFFGQEIPYFNGGIFEDSFPGADDALEVLDITQMPGALEVLVEVCAVDWRKVNPTIFGTLFEGALDAGKRARMILNWC